MASNNIFFRIGSTFEGEGFKRARQEIAAVNSNVSRGMSEASKMAGAFAGMDGAASKTMQAMTGLVGAIATFNVTAIAAQVSMMAINAYFAEMKEKAEEAKKRADELHASMEKAFSAALTGRMSSVNSEVKALADDFNRITKQANDFAAALEGVRSSAANGGVISLQVEKLNAMLEAHSDSERATIEAEYNLKIAIEKSANVETEWQSKIEAANQARTDNDARIANIGQQLATVEENRRQLEETMLAAKASGDGHWIEIQKQVNVLKDKEAALDQQRNDAIEQNTILDLKIQKVKQDAENAQASATIEIRNAELAEAKLTEEKHKAKVLAEAKFEADWENKQATIEDTSAKKTAAEIQKEANDAAAKLKAAELDYAAKLTEFVKSGFGTFDAASKTDFSGLKSGMFPVDVQKSISTTVVDSRVDDAIRNGAVTTVKDMSRLERQAQREARDLISKNQAQQLREAQQYARLKQMNPKALASSDIAFMAKYEKLLAASEKRKNDIASAKKSVDDQKRAIEESKKTLDEINKRLGKLGLS